MLYKMLGISSLGDGLLTSQEGLCSMQLVSKLVTGPKSPVSML